MTQVVLPALLDDFSCTDRDCACRRALRAVVADTPAPGSWPLAAAERALWLGGLAAMSAEGATADGQLSNAAQSVVDGPIAALAMAGDTEVYFSTLCPEVRAQLAANRDALDLLRRPDGWRLPLRGLRIDDPRPQVLLRANTPVDWSAWRRFRDVLLDALADPAQPILPRVAQVALALREPPGLTSQQSPRLEPLTSRAFLHVRAWLEARLEAQSVRWLTTAAPFGSALFPELATPSAAAWKRALQSDWREALAGPLASSEPDVQALLETWLSLQLFAMPMARGLTIERSGVAWLESLAVGLRWLAAWYHWQKQPPDVSVWLALLVAADSAVATAGRPLPLLPAPAATHDRGPRMADLDLSLAALA